MAYNTPGVYVEEVSKFPPSVAQVETAIPAFIGYTQFAKNVNGETIANSDFPYIARIKSYKEYEERFGKAANVFIDSSNNNSRVIITAGQLTITTDAPNQKFNMAYALQMYFANGGGPCYINSIETYANADFATMTQMDDGLKLVGKEDEPTILVFPDAQGLSSTVYYDLYKNALSQCALLGDRVAIVEIQTTTGKEAFSTLETTFRNGIGNNNMKYGAAYYPNIETILTYDYDSEELVVDVDGSLWKLKDDTTEGASVFHSMNESYHEIKKELSKLNVILSPGSAIAGIYAMVDSTRGVWKAPANVSLNGVKELMVNIDDEDQRDMNVHTSGKSVNAIREFTGKGVMVWGARTLAGNDNEWRYIPVRRFFNMVEESVKKASMQFVFEPNDANTWVKVRAMIENFLLLQWRAGALAGAKPEDAFYVSVGLGHTMTADDVLNGRMIVEIGMAAVRPAEFIILQFSHKMQES